jgi:hypothetical protein
MLCSVDFYDWQQGAILYLQWQSAEAGIPFQFIPESNLAAAQ